MHTIYKALLLALAFIATLASCDNTVDINDDYKEITIVYGLLDHTETTHYVKVTKAFLSEENIYLAASDPKNSQYGVDELELWMEEWDQNGVFRRTIYLDTCLITNKEEGVFYFPNQILYKTPDNTQLDNDYTYKLYVKNLVTGKLIDSKTELIGDIRLSKPSVNTKSLALTGYNPTKIQWVNGENGLLYDVSMRFFYTEINSAGDTTQKYVDWELGRSRAEAPTSKVDVTSEYTGLNFYSYLAGSLELPEQGMVRYADSVDLVLYGGNEDLTIYIDVNRPSTSIVQERPQYTNITNGMGIFASRYRYTKTFDQLTKNSIDTLIFGSKTRNLGFTYRPLK